MDSRRPPGYDWLLLLITTALLGLGLLMISSATANMARSASTWYDVPVLRQAVSIAVACVAMIAATLVNYRFWAKYRWLLFSGALLTLGAVLLAGRVLFGAQSWFEVWTFGIQPSELAKIVLIIVLARYFADNEVSLKRGTGLLVSLGLTFPLLGLIFVQPDMGTAVVLLAIWFGMLFVAGVPLRHVILLGLACLILAPLVWGLMQPYMRDRILSFLHPETDPSGQDYNVIQALISIGSGGLWGKGLGQGSQSQLAFLRVRHTDYIFSVLAEELGFVGCVLLLALMGALLLRILRIAGRTGDPFGRLVAVGVAMMVSVQVAINVGFNIGILPVTGLPLPLISYGGSSLIATLIGIGLVQSVALYHQPAENA
ncbi:MAG: rod shape-determining protein RodA [Anaerolineae bacterium]